MSLWQPCKRKIFVRKLRSLGFKGPYSGTKHQFMVYADRRLAVPSNSEYSVPQLKMMLSEAADIIERNISAEEWAELA